MEGEARAADRQQEEGRVRELELELEGRSESTGDLATCAGNAGKGTAGGEAVGDGVADVDDAAADGQAVGQDAIVHEEERVTRASELEANFAGDRRARGELRA